MRSRARALGIKIGDTLNKSAIAQKMVKLLERKDKKVSQRLGKRNRPDGPAVQEGEQIINEVCKRLFVWIGRRKRGFGGVFLSLGGGS
jgi:uncharacterized protein (DUF2147 family)